MDFSLSFPLLHARGCARQSAFLSVATEADCQVVSAVHLTRAVPPRLSDTGAWDVSELTSQLDMLAKKEWASESILVWSLCLDLQARSAAAEA